MNTAAGIFALFGAVLTIFQRVNMSNVMPEFSLCSLAVNIMSGSYSPALRRMPTGIGIAIVILVAAASLAALGAFISFTGYKATGCFVMSAVMCFAAFALVNGLVHSNGLIFREASLWGTLYIISAMCSIIYRGGGRN